MKNINALVQVDVMKLHTPLVTFQAKRLTSFTAKIVGVPEDITEVAAVLYTPNGEHYQPIQATQDSNGEWFAYFTPVQFMNVGNAKYELYGKDEAGNHAPLGSGKVVIDQFGCGTLPIPEGKSVVCAEIPDENGIMHKIRAVNTGTETEQNWTSIVLEV